jgi:glycosyltransferase involved in cell wall biosynthesis
MRILHIIQTLDPAAGGPSESVRSLMTFSGIGYTGEAVTLDPPDAPFLKNFDFPVHALGPVPLKYGFSFRLLAWLQENARRFDGVIINGLWGFPGLAALLRIRGRVPYMVFSHGMLDPYFKRAFPLKHLKKWIYWVLIEYWVLRNAYRVLFTTIEESELAKQSFWLHRWNGYVVPYGCDQPEGDPESQKRAFYLKLPQLRNAPFILYLGRIHRKKGCDMLIRAFAKHAALDPDLHLVMVGPDQQGWSTELKEIIEDAGLTDRVHWPGLLQGDLKWGAFLACEAFILPSHQENFGIAVAEALACGKAVLLSDQVNIAPQIASDGAGLMEHDDQAGTDALLERWITMPQESRLMMAAQAKMTFHLRYDMEQNAATIIRLFETELPPKPNDSASKN